MKSDEGGGGVGIVLQSILEGIVAPKNVRISPTHFYNARHAVKEYGIGQPTICWI